MKTTLTLKKFALAAFALAPAMAYAGYEDRTIWLPPGHCIVVGSQQVCAVKPADQPTTPGNGSAPKNRQMHLCKNGIVHEADPSLKGWAHVIVTISPEGKKLGQEVIKTYGPLGKKDCDAAVAQEQSSSAK